MSSDEFIRVRLAQNAREERGSDRSRSGEFLTEGNEVNEGEEGKEGGGLKPEKLKAWSEEQAPV
jgi:hypothetical protein